MSAAIVVLALACFGQVDQPRQWIRAVYADGSTRIVKGWPDEGGYVMWEESEQPYIDGQPRYRREQSKNYGLDVPAIKDDRRTIRASSPGVLADARRELNKKKPRPCPGPDCPDEPEDPARRPAGPIKRLEGDAAFAGAVAFAVACFFAAIAIIRRSRQ